MERESFESHEVADLLNSHFIPIKIDREERPDVDAIYMNYVQATTGSGGWPLNVFITPELEPVFGGTYWPGPNSSMAAVGTSMADTVGFLDILQKMKQVWTEQEQRCRDSAKDITRQLRDFAQEGVHGRCEQRGEKGDSDDLEIELLEEAYTHFERRYDKYNGGFASAPKFPTPVNLSFLLRLGQWPESVQHVVGEEECKNATDMSINTLRKMARGGIRDQLGYGFARYSVTKDWSLPHFEKMLYDQTQLLDVYLDAFLLTRDPEMLGAIYDIVTYLTDSPISAAHGGFFSSEDADSYPSKSDSEKREGAYYVWTSREIQDILGPRDSDVFCRFYGVNADGNVAPHHDPHDELINQNVLRITTTPSQLAKSLSLPESTIISILKSSRQKLREYRDTHRPSPALDDKIITCWNGLAISALARTASTLHTIDASVSSTCLSAAISAAAFIRRELYVPDTKTLYRVYSSGIRGSTQGLCEDYAFFIQGLIDLYEATFDDKHLAFADELQRVQLDRFRDSTTIPDASQQGSPAGVAGGFYTTPSPHPPDLLLRLKSGMDSAEPSANNISARNLYRLGSMLEDEDYVRAGRETVDTFEAEVQQFPFCFAGMLGSVVLGRLGMKGIVIVDGSGNTTPTGATKASDDIPQAVAASAANTTSTASPSTDEPVLFTTTTSTTMEQNPPATATAAVPAAHPDPKPTTTTMTTPSTPSIPNTTTITTTTPSSKDPSTSNDPTISTILRTLRSRIAPDRTVVRVTGDETSAWLRSRNKLLSQVKLGSASADGSGAAGVMVCEVGSCRVGGVELL